MDYSLPRHVLHLFTAFCFCFGFVALSAHPAVAAGETITFPGTPLQTVIGFTDSLAPSGSNTGKSNSLSGNKVTVQSGGTVPGVVTGAINTLDSDKVTGNQVFISGGTANGAAGGWAENNAGSATATGNSVTINGGTVNTRDVLGARAESTTGNAEASNNSVTINNGTLGKGAIGGEAVSNAGDAKASGNSVTFSNSTAEGVAGGWAWVESGTGNATASDNRVIINGGTVNLRDVLGARAESEGSGNATASNNSVTINNGTLNKDVIGGEAVSNAGSATATGNSVTISGGSVNDVIGGESIAKRMMQFLPFAHSRGIWRIETS